MIKLKRTSAFSINHSGRRMGMRDTRLASVRTDRRRSVTTKERTVLLGVRSQRVAFSYERGPPVYTSERGAPVYAARREVFLERKFFIDSLLVRIHVIIVMINLTGLARWEFNSLFQVVLHLPSSSPNPYPRTRNPQAHNLMSSCMT